MFSLKRMRDELSQYKKIFRGYLSMIVIPLLVAIVLFAVIQTLMNRQLQTFGETKAQYFQSEVSSLFQEVEIITSLMSSDKTLISYVRDTDPLLNHGLLPCDAVRDYAALSRFISRIYVVSHESDLIYASNGLYTMRSLDAILAGIGETQDSFSSVADNATDLGWHIGAKGVVEPYYIAPLTDPATGQRIGEIIVVMYTSAFYNILSDTEAALCCLFDEERYISSIGSDVNNMDIDWYSDAAISRLLEEDVRLYFAGSENFTYMVAIPTASFYAPSRLIILCFVIFFVIVFLLSVLQAIRSSRRDFQAVSKLISRLPGLAKSNPSYEELFSEMEQALVRYRDNVDRLNLETQSNSLHWILGGYAAQPVTEQNLTAAGISLSCAGYHVVTFFIRDYSDMFFDSRSETENRDIALLIFRSSLSTVAGGRAAVPCCWINGNIAAVLCHSAPDPDDRTAAAILREAADLIDRNYGLDIHMSLSSWTEQAFQLNAAYRQTCALSDFARLVDIDTDFISHRGLIREGNFNTGISYMKQLQIIINTLMVKKYEMIPQMVKTLLDKEVTSLGGNYALGRSRIACIAGFLSEAVMASEAEGVDKAGCASRLRASDSASGLAETAEQIFQDLARNSSSVSGANTVDLACAYILEHLRDPNLNIPDVCAAVGISVQHLSRLFRKQHNRTVSEYINEARINCAKELLLDKRMTAAKVALEVGYGSTDTFYRNFKKIMGITPAEYTRMSLELNQK